MQVAGTPMTRRLIRNRTIAGNGDEPLYVIREVQQLGCHPEEFGLRFLVGDIGGACHCRQGRLVAFRSTHFPFRVLFGHR